MKDILKILGVVIVCLIAGALLNRCQHPQRGEPERPEGCVTDTITYVDTIRYYQPEAKQELSLGTQIKFVPVYIRNDSTAPPQPSPQGEGVDSVAVAIPITQREYEGEDYRAWVSGYEPSLDSILVYARREVVTVREPPHKQKRWHIGPTLGYGYTPHGFQPYIGISITYSIISF